MKKFRLAAYSLYFLSGLVITTIGSVLPQLLTYYDISYTVGGQLVFLGSIGFLIGVPLSTFLIHHINEKTVLSIAASLVAAAQFGLLTLPPAGFIFALNFMNGIGVAMLETIVATLMIEIFVGRRAVEMSYLEVSFGLGALSMPVIASILIAMEAWRFSFLLTGCLAVVMVFVWSTLKYSKKDVEETTSMDAAMPPVEVSSTRTMWQLIFLFVLMIFIYSGIEGSLNNYLSSIFISYLGEAAYYASLSIGMFWVAMVIGRFATGFIIRRVSYSRYLFWSMGGTVLVLISFILLQHPVLAYLLVILMGFTMSGVYSITMVYANHTFPGQSRLITSLITGFAGLGGAIFPGIIGFTMDRFSVAVSLWFIAGFAVLYLGALLTVLSISKSKSKANQNGPKPD